MNILAVFGTRPEAIKMAPVILELERRNRVVVCVSGQHSSMLEDVLDFFQIKPKYNFHLMSKVNGLNGLIGEILVRLDEILDKESPDVVLVHGDTSTAMASSIASFNKGVAVAHVEAGLRTYNLTSPWPEEANRQLISRVSSMHFSPTEQAKKQLLNERVQGEVHVTGNTVIDALYLAKNLLTSHTMRGKVDQSLASKGVDSLAKKSIVVVTTHRRENLGLGLDNIVSVIVRLAKKFPGVHFLYPVHLNPDVRSQIYKEDLPGNILLVEPLMYGEFVYCLLESVLIMTDSGGIQEEAEALGKATLVLRDTTERPEILASEYIELVGTNTENIFDRASYYIDRNQKSYCSNQHMPVVGDGKASIRIGRILNDCNE